MSSRACRHCASHHARAGMLGALATALLLLTSSPATASTMQIAAWDFESDDGGFVSGGDLPEWAWGVPTAGPDAAHGGDRLWGTALSDRYLRENVNTLTLASVDLSTTDQPYLLLYSWLDLASGDSAHIEVDTGGTWQIIDPVYGYGGTDSLVSTDSDWDELYVDLSSLTNTDQLRLVLDSATSRAYGWYVDDLSVWSGDIVPPKVSEVSAPTEWTRFDQGPTITATIEDNVALVSTELQWLVDTSTESGSSDTVGSDNTSGTVTLDDLGGGIFEVTLPVLPPGAMTWTIQADDGQKVTLWPDDGTQDLDVYLPAPGELTGPDGHWWGSTVPLSWIAPDNSETVTGYRIYRDGDLVSETAETTTSADVTAVGPTDSFVVSALYSTTLGTLEGRPSASVQVSVAVPRLTNISPDTVYQGDVLHVSVTGSSLLFDANSLGADALDLGEGISSDSVTVENVDTAIFTLSVSETATIGSRDVVLSLQDEQILLEDSFSILDGADRPALLSVDPAALDQGVSDTLLLTLTAPADALPQVDLGQGVVVESIQVDGLTLTVTVAVANDAPLGTRDVYIDDGTRILVLTDGFRVWAQSTELSQPCGCGTTGQPSTGSARPLLWLLLTASVLSGRRRSRL